MISYIIGKIPMGLTAMLSMVAFVLTQSLLPAAILCVVAVGWIMTVFPMF